jgi:hypothetical protein
MLLLTFFFPDESHSEIFIIPLKGIPVKPNYHWKVMGVDSQSTPQRP